MTNKYARNFYKCSCGESWSDDWDCACDDRCPKCNTSISPHTSSETGLCLALWAALGMYQDQWLEVNSYGDDDTPHNCECWADECSIIAKDYPDFYAANNFEELAIDFQKKVEELHADGYGV